MVENYIQTNMQTNMQKNMYNMQNMHQNMQINIPENMQENMKRRVLEYRGLECYPTCAFISKSSYDYTRLCETHNRV